MTRAAPAPISRSRWRRQFILLHPPVHVSRGKRDTSPIIRSVTDVCVVTQLRVAVDVIVTLVASGCTLTSGGGDSTRIPRDGAGAGKCRPGAETGGDTSPQLRRMRQRSVKEMARGLLVHVPDPMRTRVTWVEPFYESLGCNPSLQRLQMLTLLLLRPAFH